VIATRPVDFRKGAQSLAALASALLSEDPFFGVIIIFRAKRVDRVEILVCAPAV
jgi:transposase